MLSVGTNDLQHRSLNVKLLIVQSKYQVTQPCIFCEGLFCHGEQALEHRPSYFVTKVGDTQVKQALQHALGSSVQRQQVRLGLQVAHGHRDARIKHRGKTTWAEPTCVGPASPDKEYDDEFDLCIPLLATNPFWILPLRAAAATFFRCLT